MLFLMAVLALALTLSEAVTFPSVTPSYRRSNTEKSRSLAAVLPGDPIITGGLAMGAASAVSLYSKVILARYDGYQLLGKALDNEQQLKSVLY